MRLGQYKPSTRTRLRTKTTSELWRRLFVQRALRFVGVKQPPRSHDDTLFDETVPRRPFKGVVTLDGSLDLWITWLPQLERDATSAGLF